MTNANVFTNATTEILKKCRFDHSNKIIVMPKSIAKKASAYGSAEYVAMIEIKENFAEFEIQIREVNRSTSRKDTLKGLTLEYMERFIERNGSAEQMEHFKMLCTPTHDGLTMKRTPYGSIKKWFIAEFPQVLDYQKQVAQILSRSVA